MALLWLEKSKRGESLSTRNVIGRGPECSIRLKNRKTSGNHAVLTWKKGGWVLRDLGSRNGTFLNDEPVKPGKPVLVPEGATLRFGSDDLWQMRNAGAPGPVAVCGQRVEAAEGGMLVLPNEEDPQVLVYADENGDFTVERDGECQPYEADQTVDAGGSSWRVLLPHVRMTSVPATTLSVSAGSSLEAVGLIFTVSQDEEHIDVVLRMGRKHHPLTARVHHFLMLQLARVFLDDVAGGVSASERGWAYAEDLSRQLRVRPAALNLYMVRARQQLTKAGVEGAGRLFERRRLSGQIRLRVEDLEICSA